MSPVDRFLTGAVIPPTQITLLGDTTQLTWHRADGVTLTLWAFPDGHYHWFSPEHSTGDGQLNEGPTLRLTQVLRDFAPPGA